MANIGQILADRTAYPDDRKITLADGVETTVGELRDQLIPKGDMTRATQKLAEEKRALESQLAAAGQQLAQMQQQATAQTLHGGDPDDLSPYEQDTTFGPLAKRLRKLEQEKATLEKNVQQTLRQHEQAFWMNQHLRALERLKASDPDINEQELLTFAQQRSLVNLDDAYKLKYQDKLIAKEREAAEKAAYERGKKEAKLPPVPTSRPSGGQPPETKPTTLDEAFAKLEIDPSVDELYQGVMQ